MCRGVGHRPGADQAMPPVDVEVRFVAKHRHRDLDAVTSGTVLGLRLGTPTLECPARVTVLLPSFRRFPFRRNAALLDGRLLDRKSTRLNSSHMSISYA